MLLFAYFFQKHPRDDPAWWEILLALQMVQVLWAFAFDEAAWKEKAIQGQRAREAIGDICVNNGLTILIYIFTKTIPTGG